MMANLTRQRYRIEPWLIRQVARYVGPAPAVQVYERVWTEENAGGGSIRRVWSFSNYNTLDPDRS